MNLIGEHTDYDDGFVLPAAINRSINSAISKGRDSKCRLYASNIQERCESYLARLEKSSKRWADYRMGVVNQLQKAGYSLPGVDRLFGGDIPMGAELEPVVYNRCRYVLEENNRVESACKALAMNGYKRLGELLYDSHDGLRNKYDVSCEELDLLVESATRMDGVVGARMMGAGFGGCTSNLVARGFMHGFEARIKRENQKGTGQEP